MKQFVDTETTGVYRKTDDIIQLTSIVTTDDYKVVEVHDYKFQSPKVNAGCLRIQGLTFEEYERNHRENMIDYVTELYNLFKKTDMVIYAYNQSFDVDMIKANMERCGLPVVQLSGKEVMKKRIKLAKNMSNRGYNLDEVMAYTRKLFPHSRGFHDATFDTVCTMLIARDDRL